MKFNKFFSGIIFIILLLSGPCIYSQDKFSRTFNFFDYRLKYDLFSSPISFKSLDSKLVGIEHRISLILSKKINNYSLNLAIGAGLRKGMGEVINSNSLNDKYTIDRFYSNYSKLTYGTKFIGAYLGRELISSFNVLIGIEYYYFQKLDSHYFVPSDPIHGKSSFNSLIEIERRLNKRLLLSARYSLDNNYLVDYVHKGKNNKYGISLSIGI